MMMLIILFSVITKIPVSICRNNYIPKYTSPKERDFLSHLDDLKYEQATKNPDKYFQNVKIINFDIINHECREDPLQNSYHRYYTIAKRFYFISKER